MESAAQRITEIKDLIEQTSVTSKVLEIVEQAITACPESAELWCLRGDLIQLCDDETAYELMGALKSYQQAAVMNPNSFEAYEEMGYYHDVIENNFDEAELAFRKAIELGAGIDSFVGLARVLAQAGKQDESLLLLSSCPYSTDSNIKEMEGEIKSGIWSNG